MLSTLILGTGHYAPERVLTNDALSQLVETSDEWIRTRSGIRERRIAGEDQKTSDLATEAARRALADAGVAPTEIDLLIVATITPDTPMPAIACLLQHRLEVPTTAACFDLNAACSGFIYALDTACAMISSGRYRKPWSSGRKSYLTSWTGRIARRAFCSAMAPVRP
jgi:3-oxoacyl-[acyl-carrier-protein] synthase-3